MKKLLYLMTCCMFFYFIKSPSKAFLASQNGILLWFNQILPTLLPFTILSNILVAVWAKDGKLGGKTFLHINLWEWFVIVCGLFFGFPIGSKLTADIYENGQTTKERAQVLCAFTNNMSPAFISAFVCENKLQMPHMILPVFLALYAPPVVIGCLRLSAMQLPAAAHKNTASRFPLDMQIIDAGIVNSFLTMIKLCGYIVMFSITADLFRYVRFIPAPLCCLTVGITEVTNGIAQLACLSCNDTVKVIFAVGFLGFGGLSGLAQTNSVLSPCGLPILRYLASKLLYTACSLAAISMYLFGCRLIG